jgi:hypothetical protein
MNRFSNAQNPTTQPSRNIQIDKMRSKRVTEYLEQERLFSAGAIPTAKRISPGRG